MSNFNLQNEFDEISSIQKILNQKVKVRKYIIYLNKIVNSDFHHSRMKLNSNNIFAFQVKYFL